MRVLTGIGTGRSMCDVEGKSYGTCGSAESSTEIGGIAAQLSATGTGRGAVVGDGSYVRVSRSLARSKFRQNALNYASSKTSHP